MLSELTNNNTNQPLSTSESLSSILATKHNTLQQDNEKKLKLSYDFSTLLTCPNHSKPVKINIGNIRKHYPNSYRTVKQQNTSSNVHGNNNNNNVKDIHSLYTIIKPNHNKKTKSKHSKESKTQSNSKSTSRDKSNTNTKTNQYNIYNYNYIRHNKHLLALDNNSNSNNFNINNNKKHFSNSDKSGCPLLNEKLFSKLNLKPYTTSNNNNTPSSIINTTSSVIKTNNNNNNSKRENTSINLNIYCNNNIKKVHIKQVKHSKNKKANSNTSHSNSNTNRSHYHSSINSYRSNRLGKNPNMLNIQSNHVVSGINKDQRHNTSKIPHKKKLTKKKLNKSKQEHTIVINYNNERLPLMIVNKKEKERICKQIERKCEQYEMIEKIKAEYIDLSEQEEVVKKVKEEIAGDKNVSASKHSRDQNTKVSNKNNKNEEIMKQIKNSLDDNLKVMFNFSYENFLSKESETESKKSSEQEILITESYET